MAVLAPNVPPLAVDPPLVITDNKAVLVPNVPPFAVDRPHHHHHHHHG